MLRHTRFTSLMIVSVAFGLLLTTGCGSKGVAVSGKIVLPKDVKLEKDDQIELTFSPVDGGQTAALASVNRDDLTFVAHSASGQSGVPLGKYKVVAHITPYLGQPGSAKRAQVFNAGFNNAYSSTNSKMIYEVVSGGENILTIDLITGNVTKN